MALISSTTLFAVMSEPDNQPLANAIAGTFPENFIQVRPGQWFIVTGGTSKELSDRLKVTTGETGSAVVVSVSGYYGRASSQIWEWIAAKVGKPTNG